MILSGQDLGDSLNQAANACWMAFTCIIGWNVRGDVDNIAFRKVTNLVRKAPRWLLHRPPGVPADPVRLLAVIRVQALSLACYQDHDKEH